MIERTLIDSGLIRAAAVIPYQDQAGEKGLVAYIVPRAQPPPTVSALRRILEERLPDYMLPSAFVPMDALPRNMSGKVDRLALPPPTAHRPHLDNDFVAPRDELERGLARICERVLGIEPVGVEDNLYDLGGHSLLAARLVIEIDETYGQQLPDSAVLQAPTVEKLAGLLRSSRRGPAPPSASVVAISAAGAGTPLFFAPGSMSNVFTHLGHLARHLGEDRPFYGLQEACVDPTRIEEQAARYVTEIRALQPSGPYLLGGVCHGGVLAFETAQQLRDQGQQVALLALVEPSPLGSSGPAAYARLAAKVLRQAPPRVSRLVRRPATAPAAGEDEYLRQKMRLVANVLATIRYEPKPYAGRVDLFVTVGSLTGPRARDLYWQALVLDPMRIHQIPGTHAGVVGSLEASVDEASMMAVASKLRACLDEVSPGA